MSQLLRYGLAVLSLGVAVGTLLLFEHVGWRTAGKMPKSDAVQAIEAGAIEFLTKPFDE